jgi:NAD(P)-dependent dehydrogenase (short-subunit alcohol dehydrogenase family)
VRSGHLSRILALYFTVATLLLAGCATVGRIERGEVAGRTFVVTGVQQGYGSLVNVGSIDSEVPLAYQATYSASKAAVLGLGRALNEELRLAGLERVRVSTVMPWAADTPVWTHAANYSGGTMVLRGSALLHGPRRDRPRACRACTT